MEESTSKEKVFKNVRNALIDRSDNPYPSVDFESPVFADRGEGMDITFAEEFTRVGGNFIYCENHREVIQNLSDLVSGNKWSRLFCSEPAIGDLLKEAGLSYSSDEKDFLDMETGFTSCEYLIARLGSIMVSSRQLSGRRMHGYPENHVVIGYSSQLVPNLKNALSGIRERYRNNLPSMITVITGPSRTADIEKTLVMGAHGPKNLFLFLIEDRSNQA
jgi:L-lactate dehydrogenase complex protein LldG